MGYIGQIRGYETTHGRKGTNNGWHPHFHFLQFVMVKGAAQLMGLENPPLSAVGCLLPKGRPWPRPPAWPDLRDGSFANTITLPSGALRMK